MPILDIEIVGTPPGDAPDRLARSLAEAAGEALQSRPGGTWVKLRFLPPAHYAENAGGPPPGVAPVFVSIIERTIPTGDALTERIDRLTAAIAAATGRPDEHVHILYEPAARARLAFGGTLVE